MDQRLQDLRTCTACGEARVLRAFRRSCSGQLASDCKHCVSNIKHAVYKTNKQAALPAPQLHALRRKSVRSSVEPVSGAPARPISGNVAVELSAACTTVMPSVSTPTLSPSPTEVRDFGAWECFDDRRLNDADQAVVEAGLTEPDPLALDLLIKLSAAGVDMRDAVKSTRLVESQFGLSIGEALLFVLHGQEQRMCVCYPVGSVNS